MKPELKKLLKAYFKVMKERQEEIEVWNEDKQSFELEESHFKEKLNTIRIGILRDKNFDFNKDRTYDEDRLKLEGEDLEICRFRHKHFNAVDAFNTSVVNDDNFQNMIEELEKLIEDHKITGEYNATYGTVEYTYYEKEKDEKYNIILKMNINVEYIDEDDGIKQNKITELKINQFVGDIKKESIGYEHLSLLLYNDHLYKKVKELIGLFKEARNKREEKFRELIEQGDKIIDKYGFMDYILLEKI